MKERQVQVASNSGWSEFCEWVETTDMEDYPSLHHLVEFGFDNDPEDLRDDIEDAIREHPPDPDVVSVAEGLVDFLDDQLEAEIIIVSNGMTAE